MNGHTYLTLSLISARLVLFVAFIGPLASRWHQKLERDLQRMKKTDRRHP